jgi:hypothetical protein
MLDNFLTQGYIIENDKSVIKFINLDNVKWIEDKNLSLQICKKEKLIENQLLDIQKYLGEKCVKQIDKNYKLADKIELVNGIDNATLMWHNDLVEGPNLCILAYFDTMDEDIGGAICFRETETKKELINYYPQQYDIIIMNQSMKFEHIVTPLKLKLPRRVASFNYYINERLTK